VPRKALKLIFAVLLFSMSAVTAARAANVTGYVRDHSSAPVSGATVVLGHLVGQSYTTMTITTDNNGYYAFTGLTNGTYGLGVVKPAWVIGPFLLFFSDSINNNFFGTYIVSSFTVSGHVRNAVGTPIWGAGFTLVSVSSALATNSDSSGYYQFTGLLSDAYVLTPIANDWVFTPNNETFTPLVADQPNKDFTGYPLIRVDGFVRTASSSPIGGVTMTLTTLVNPSTTYVKSTNASGYFEFRDVLGDNYTLTAVKNNWLFSPLAKAYTPLSVYRSSENFTGFTIVSTYSISGYVKDVSSSPLGGITVNLSGSDSAAGTTDPAGYYSFVNITSGAYSVTPGTGAWFFSPPVISIPQLNSSQSNRDFTAYRATFSVSGYVRDSSGTAVPEVAMVLSGDNAATVVTDANGYYILQNISSGTYTVSPSKADYTFNPVSRSYSPLNSNRQNENYTSGTGSGSGGGAGGGSQEAPAETVKPAKFHIGSAGAIRKKIQELDEKVRNSKSP